MPVLHTFSPSPSGCIVAAKPFLRDGEVNLLGYWDRRDDFDRAALVIADVASVTITVYLDGEVVGDVIEPDPEDVFYNDLQTGDVWANVKDAAGNSVDGFNFFYGPVPIEYFATAGSYQIWVDVELVDGTRQHGVYRLPVRALPGDE